MARTAPPEPARAGPATAPAAPVRVIPVIMAGGAGSRLWPLADADRPKPFRAFGSPRTLLQETALRLSGEGFAAPVVVCNRRHRTLVLQQLAEIGVAPQAVVAEPFGRDTAAACAVGAEMARRLEPGARALLAPADHQVTDADAFRAAVRIAAAAAGERIVTLGLRPDRPETGYGYIHLGVGLAEGVFAVERFVEKPDAPTAQAYLADGGYLWNAGLFVADPDLLLAELAAHRPEIARAALRSLDLAERRGVELALDDAAFAACPAEPFDRAVMENTRRAAVVPCDMGWADLGAWDAVWRVSPQDADGNVASGETVLVDARGCLVRGEGVGVAVIGVEDLVVVATPERVLVTTRAQAQAAKDAGRALDARVEQARSPAAETLRVVHGR